MVQISYLPQVGSSDASASDIKVETEAAVAATPGPIASRSTSHLSNKERGAYYTDSVIACFIMRWVIAAGNDTVLDPSFGDGSFLEAATERVRQLGGDSRNQVYGVEIDETAVQRYLRRRPDDIDLQNLWNRNFFEVGLGDLPQVDAVVGNPPFVRYQRFTGRSREIALLRARHAGVRLSNLASSWAPFLVYAVQFIKPSGRLAMVAPVELTHAAYARPVLRYLHNSFKSIRIVTFAKPLFPALSEATLLILAEGRGQAPETMTLHDLPGPVDLAELWLGEKALPEGISVNASLIADGQERLLHYLLPQSIRELYAKLRNRQDVRPLGALADVGIGYVTGDNSFFHVDQSKVASFGIPDGFLRPAVRSGSHLSGLRFLGSDWEQLRDAGEANQLVSIPAESALPRSLVEYLESGVQSGIPTHYKCRIRQPWYSVPHVYQADCFLTYMSGAQPKLVANEADAVAPNALHIVRLLDRPRPLSALALSALWQTSLTALSCEMEGHALGGGMLKLEPSEAEKVAVASPSISVLALEGLAIELDKLVRNGDSETARERADEVILGCGLGLSRSDIHLLREGWRLLRDRRLHTVV